MSNRSLYLMCLITAVLFILSVEFVRANELHQAQLGNDEQEFIFVGHCKGGANYKIISYEKNIDGVKQSFYDYSGPLGKDTVKSDLQPKEMVALVCQVSPKA